ncbi:MAG: hypothetical protein QNJ71_02695 [Acidimicrobiia bacterium]|nr:hypothetical protein [Acidimicrobiia bacterium]
MSIRVVLLACLAALAVAACTPGSTESTERTSTTSEPATTTMALPAEPLVVATASGDVIVYDRDLAETVAIRSGESAAFRQPVWLSTDALLYGEASADGTSALVSADAVTGGERWKTTFETLPFYYLPAPVGSEIATTSLRTDPDGDLIAELVALDGSAEVISTDAPFYTSWSPDGMALAIHAGQERLSIRDAGDETVIADVTGVFQAPAWTEIGLVTLRTVGGAQFLSVWTEDGGFRDIASIEGPVRFVAGGGKVAIQSAAVSESNGVQASTRTQEVPNIPGGRLAVVDLETGQIDTVADVLAAVYQWDPSGDRLLYATFDDGSTLNLTWHVWSSGEIRDLSSFLAQAAWFRDFVPFFDQYDQSVSIWSPSGDRIAYPAVQDERLVVVVEETDGSGEDIIDDATWASWASTR